MRLTIKKLVVLGALLALYAGSALATPFAGAAQPRKTSGKSAKHASHRHGKRKASWKKKGQQAIKPERAAEIQQALIRENYLSGEPNGVWDTRTQAALVKYQADNGWQTKVVPDSRALIKLGLGPNYSSETLLNAPATTAPATSAASRGLNGAADKQ